MKEYLAASEPPPSKGSRKRNPGTFSSFVFYLNVCEVEASIFPHCWVDKKRAVPQKMWLTCGVDSRKCALLSHLEICMDSSSS